jgi:hypothetical protein
MYLIAPFMGLVLARLEASIVDKRTFARVNRPFLNLGQDAALPQLFPMSP